MIWQIYWVEAQQQRKTQKRRINFLEIWISEKTSKCLCDIFYTIYHHDIKYNGI